MSKICLSMIVRDEEHVMDRCLMNCKNSIDAITIVDTGSIDKTVEKTKAFLQKENIPGGVRSLPWREFDRSRNDALEYTFELVRESFGLPKTGPITKKQYDDTLKTPWYWFMHDADDGILSKDCKEEVRENNLVELIAKYPGNIKEALAKAKVVDQYLIWITTGSCGFYYSRLFRIHPSGARAMKWHNPVHEVAYNEIGGTTDILPGIQVFSGKTGGRSKRGNKFIGDLNVFTTSIANGRIPPACIPRAMFYMAQSAMDCQYFDQAIYYYKERVNRKEGTYFERYVAYIRISHLMTVCRSAHDKEITEECIRFEQLKNFWAAFNLCDHRREANYELAKYHEGRKEYGIAWFYLEKGLQHDEPLVNDSFSDMTLFGYKYYDLVYLVAWYANKKDDFVKYGRRVATDQLAPDAVRDKAKENLLKFANVKI